VKCFRASASERGSTKGLAVKSIVADFCNKIGQFQTFPSVRRLSRLSVIFCHCAHQVAKLLRGAKVVDVPVEQPT
ncbi:hypothetical protein ABIB85_007257, partial [Bradyrhizobium sp. JR1.5]|uniref:hypothetical protein n=1 Tax=unclassified Bradyrhizobium TaxID=2631580 RepID=UPI003391DC8B